MTPTTAADLPPLNGPISLYSTDSWRAWSKVILFFDFFCEYKFVLDKRIVKEKDFYKLFGIRGIFEILLPNKEETINGKTKILNELDFDLSQDPRSDRYMSITAYTVFLKIWTANVIAKYIFKIYHDTSFTYVKGDTYPTIGEIMSSMETTEDYNIKEEQSKILDSDRSNNYLSSAINYYSTYDLSLKLSDEVNGYYLYKVSY